PHAGFRRRPSPRAGPETPNYATRALVVWGFPDGRSAAALRPGRLLRAHPDVPGHAPGGSAPPPLEGVRWAWPDRGWVLRPRPDWLPHRDTRRRRQADGGPDLPARRAGATELPGPALPPGPAQAESRTGARGA